MNISSKLKVKMVKSEVLEPAVKKVTSALSEAFNKVEVVRKIAGMKLITNNLKSEIRASLENIGEYITQYKECYDDIAHMKGGL